jgi:glucan phosphoethanolaminetransferase (alkaline phosphatase superfamily)
MQSIYKNPIPLAFFFIIIILISLTDIVFSLKEHFYSNIFFNLIFSTCFYLLPFYFFRNRLRWYYWLFLPLIILSIFVTGAYIFFNIRINAEILLLVLHTNKEEAKELTGAYIPYFILLSLVFLITFIFLVLKLPKKISKIRGAYVSLISLLIALIIPIIYYGNSSYIGSLKNSLSNTFPISYIYLVELVRADYKEMHSNDDVRKNFRFNAKQVNAPPEKQIYVLIIGESGRAGQWGINGYKRKTSPRLSQRSNLISFSNTTASAFVTELAVPIIVTEATADNFMIQAKEASIVRAFQEAGFKTYWMSNQVDEGYILAHAKEAENSFISLEAHRYDMELVSKDLSEILNKNEQKVFVVLHTWGSHWNYSERYPPSYEFFKPSAKYDNILPSDASKKELIINSYDNTILYTDAVIDSAISLVNQKNACSTIFYIADHGDNLFDDSKDKFLHADPIPSKWVAHIPFMVWYSDQYKSLFPDRIKNLTEHKNYKTGSDDVFHSLAEMGCLSFASLDTSKSVANKNFKESRQIILGANSNVFKYDSLP